MRVYPKLSVKLIEIGGLGALLQHIKVELSVALAFCGLGLRLSVKLREIDEVCCRHLINIASAQNCGYLSLKSIGEI